MDDKIKNEQGINVINISQMVVASISKGGEKPEDACWHEVLNLIKENQLDQKPDFRILGHGYNEANGTYIYELWVTISDDISVPYPFTKKEFSGGLYASLTADLSNIGDKWQELQDILTQSEIYKHDTNPKRDMYLEECIDFKVFHSSTTDSGKQLSLLLPIIRYNKQLEIDTIDEIKSMEVILPDLLLGGTSFPFNETVRPWKKRVPWYQLAQNIYKVGAGFSECMNHGNNTFTLVYGKTINPLPFYFDMNKGKVDKVFAAVELVKSFPIYPEGLEEYILTSNKYMVFAIVIHPKDAKAIKLDFKALYEAASRYFKGSEDKAREEYCLEREYRFDGRYVDKIELYIPLKG